MFKRRIEHRRGLPTEPRRPLAQLPVPPAGSCEQELKPWLVHIEINQGAWEQAPKRFHKRHEAEEYANFLKSKVIGLDAKVVWDGVVKND